MKRCIKDLICTERNVSNDKKRKYQSTLREIQQILKCTVSTSKKVKETVVDLTVNTRVRHHKN